MGGEEGRKEGEKERKQGGSKAGRKAGRKEGGGFRFVYFAMSSGTWQQNGFGGVHNTAKEPPSFLEKRRSQVCLFCDVFGYMAAERVWRSSQHCERAS